MAASIVAGSIAAVVAALVSLPLRSPDDILLNSVTVVAGALLAGIAAGLIWRVLSRHRRRTLLFLLSGCLGFGLIALLAAAGETQLDHFAAFVLPLGAIVVSLTALLTLWLVGRPLPGPKWLPLAAVVIALAVGIGLAGQGDEESGKLELPPRAGVYVLPQQHSGPDVLTGQAT